MFTAFDPVHGLEIMANMDKQSSISMFEGTSYAQFFENQAAFENGGDTFPQSTEFTPRPVLCQQNVAQGQQF